MFRRRVREPGYALLARYRLLLLVAVCCAGLAGFLYGRSYEHDSQEGQILSVPGLQDYQALAYYNHYSIVRAKGPSMQPTLAEYNFLLVRDTTKIRRGDVIISNHHGMHRVLGLHGETVSLTGGHVRVCTPQAGGPQRCSVLAEPWVRYPSQRDLGPMHADGGYVTVPDNRGCCSFLVFVPDDDVVGVYAGSLLSYGPLGPPGSKEQRPRGPTLVYEPPAHGPK